MILWCDGAHGARENMRRDAALLDAAVAGALAEPVMRLFAFAPHGITLGHSQDPARELDLERVEREGLEWAVRPTGGRAIYHAQEWTFSLAAAGVSDPAAAYARTCRWLLDALRGLGVPADLSPGSPRGVGRPRAAQGAAAPCFASSARHELTLGGRKLAGIAQRTVRGALLQQGSLLLGPGHLALAEYLRVGPQERERARAALESAAVDAGTVLGPEAPLQRLADALEGVRGGLRRVDGEGAGILPA